MALGSPRKMKSFSWEIEGSDYVRHIAFKPLKGEEKIGFGLGGKGRRTEVVVIREGTQAYWKGVLVGYKIVDVNKKKVNDITVKSAIQDMIASKKEFTIGFQVPNKPDWADGSKEGVMSSKGLRGGPRDDKPPAIKTKPIKDDDIKEATSRASRSRKARTRGNKKARDDDYEAPILDHGDMGYEDNHDDGGFFMGDNDIDDDDDFVPHIRKKHYRGKLKEEVEEKKREKFKFKPRPKSSLKGSSVTGDYSIESLEKKTKLELEELEREKAKEYDDLKKSEEELKKLIKEKEAEFKERRTREGLEELKDLRKKRKELQEKVKKTLEELERIREMLRRRLAELEAGIKDLNRSSTARDAKLKELELTVSQLELKMLNG